MEDSLPSPDDDIVESNHSYREQKHREKAARMTQGLDDRVCEADDGLTPEAVAELSIADREARWGFTTAELAAATKVVTRLFQCPFLYVGDPILAESRLYTMVSRDRKTKRENKDTFKLVSSAERSRRQQQQRREDLDAIKKTQMKAERDAALNRLLTAPSSSDEEGEPEHTPTLLLADKPATLESPPTAAAGSGLPVQDLSVNRRQKCHICKNPYHELHHFYYALCRPCGDFNYQKRMQSRDLRGKVVLLTGCRIKIGYAMTLSLLRAGATLIGTTRFVHDALTKLQQEPDYTEWSTRVHLFAIDFRDLWMTTQLCAFLRLKFPKIFAIINNAAQTIARTPEYTSALRHYEARPDPKVHATLTENPLSTEWMSFVVTHGSVAIGQPMVLEAHPIDPSFDEPAASAVAVRYPKPRHDRYDTVAEATDHRQHNSWTAQLHEVSGGEASEVMAINALAPFIINSKLKPCLANREGETDQSEARYIINVSAMEGQFYRFKQTTHPHTNMAKAALNMMTRTSAADYAKDGIFMNSVDTGWITDESPLPKRQRRADEFKLCPLDEVDAAARCLDPIYTNSREHGKFFKDYHEIPW